MTDQNQLLRDYLDCVAELLQNEQVQSMRKWPHHLSVSCYEHSRNVSVLAYQIALHIGGDGYAAARAGLLHDFYLYAASDYGYSPLQQALAHPKAALTNAKILCPDLTQEEADAIVNHMWPVAAHPPRTRTALAVNVADKTCCVMEVVGVTLDRLRDRLSAQDITPDLP